MVERSHVPCNGCRACCIGQAVLLYPQDGDIIASYDAVPTINPLTGEPAWELNHKDNHECVYLGPDGCTIYERAPAVCKSFDCRIAFLEYGDRAERRRMLKASKDPVMLAGSKRAATVTVAELEARRRDVEAHGGTPGTSASLLRLWQATRADVSGGGETRVSARPRARR